MAVGVRVGVGVPVGVAVEVLVGVEVGVAVSPTVFVLVGVGVLVGPVTRGVAVGGMVTPPLLLKKAKQTWSIQKVKVDGAPADDQSMSVTLLKARALV